MQHKENHQQQCRKAYSKPAVERVKLIPKESVLAVCKADPNPSAVNYMLGNCVQGNCHDTLGFS